VCFSMPVKMADNTKTLLAYHASEFIMAVKWNVLWYRPQVAAWVPDMFCNFYFSKNHKIGNNSTTYEAGEKVSLD
jgi:hypothetical protein